MLCYVIVVNNLYSLLLTAFYYSTLSKVVSLPTTLMTCVCVAQEEDEWCPARIVRCRSVAVPHTTLQQKTFDVIYTPLLTGGVASGDNHGGKDKEESGVKSDRIRLVQKPVVAMSAPVIIESTGAASNRLCIGKYNFVVFSTLVCVG